ncbi:protein starmaker isoform X2 [Anastrepha obliqua]|uniref:protein starmaker isoform X2 n=1 Tax=Anastrepha obliqua TaxID=95512 RepID=UPI002408F5E9|nr:protein starmaker isoform X2 [Anastrepha obliqua]
MSGDVQPRKRKDKKKRRDDESSHGVHITKMGNDDVHLHIQHEHGTGGHWCAKIFFFSLLAILFGLVALIILENRGISDLDTPLSESRFSNYFDGWVDESRQEHDDHHPLQASKEDHDEHDEPFEEEEDHSELDEDADEEHDEDDDHDDEDDEDATTEQTKELEEDENNDERDEENDDGDDDDEDEEEDATKEAILEQTNEEEDDDENENDNNTEEEDDDNLTQEATTKEEDDRADADDDNDNDDGDDDEGENNTNEQTVEASQEANEDDNNDSAYDKNEDDNNDDDDDADDVEPSYERSTQQITTSQQSETNKANDDDDDDDAFDEEDDDDTFDSIENVVDNDAEELLLLQEKARKQAAEAAKNEPASTEKDKNEDTAEAVPSWASSLAVKIGVGVALALVARLVLIRNNPNTNEEPAPEVVMKRRLTIATEEDTYENDDEAPPLSDDGDYSEEEIEIEEEYEYDEEVEMPEDAGDKLSALAGEYIPETFEQLNNLYRSRLSEPEQSRATSTPRHIEEVKDQSFAQKKAPAIFTAPPPPSTSEMSSKKVSPLTTTTTILKTTPSVMQTQSPTPLAPTTSTIRTTKAETMKPMQHFSATPTKTTTKPYMPDSPKPARKHEITHDMDYQPDEEDIDYDDDDDDGVDGAYIREVLEDTEEEDEEGQEDEEDIDDDLLDDEDISDVDDTELMNRLEAKYGRLPAKEYESDEDPDDPTWTQIKPKEDIGGGPQAQNDELGMFERELRRANEEMMRENYAEAIKRFDQLARQYPDKPQVFLAQARLLDKQADRKHSNDLLSQALQAYKRYLALDSAITDNVEFRIVAERCIERMRFMGHHMQAVPIHRQLIKRFADEPNVRNQLAITYLLQNRLSYAKSVLQDVLSRWPNDGFAQAHYGFVLRQLDLDYANAVIYLRKGIDSKATGTQDGRFYFNLGDSLQRLGRQAEAVEVYRRGAALKLFPSAYQRSLYNEPNLLAKPFWTKAETTYDSYFNKLELNWRTIRDEALSLLSRRGYFLDEAESLRDTGNWQQFELYARGQQRVQNCRKAPITCGLIEKFSAAAGCRRGQVKFSVMQPGTHVHAHCGPTNCRLRAHLGLVVPEGTRLRVAEEERTWTEGQILIFDDSFEHEVWHNGSSFRLVLIVDVWHPDLSAQQRRTLSPI